MTLQDLIGKTITQVERKRLSGYSDTGFLEMHFSDGTAVTLVAGFGGWMNPDAPGFKPENEYPTSINIVDKNKYKRKLVKINHEFKKKD